MLRRNHSIILRELIRLLTKCSPKESVIKGYRLWRREGLKGIYGHFTAAVNYDYWIEKNDTLDLEDRKQISSHIDALEYHPLISIVMPVCNAQEKWVALAVESVRRQLYPHWELCIVDVAATEPHIAMTLNEIAESDRRIKSVSHDADGHISTASNSALKFAMGEFVTLLNQNDELAEHALYMVVASLNERPHLDIIYSDEDKVDESGKRFDPYFKPDWNPDLFLSQDMISSLCVYRSSIVSEVGGFRKDFGSYSNWDLALRVTRSTSVSQIHHISHVLYHRRDAGVAAEKDSKNKNHNYEARMAAVTEHLEKSGQPGKVSAASCGTLHVQYDLPEPIPLVSIIIPVRNGVELLRCCIDSLLGKTCYKHFEIIVVDNQSDDPEALEYLSTLEEAGIARVLEYDKPFNYSAINNFAALAANGSMLCLMNNDIEVISGDWLDEMVGHAVRDEIGAVGAMLYYPDDTIQHAGVLVGMGGCAGHIYADMPRGTAGYACRAKATQNLSAVTAACLVVRKSLFVEVGGLEEDNLSVAFNDVDFCLRVMEQGYRNLWTPFAELYHHESASRGSENTPKKQQRAKAEIAYMHSRWPGILNNDPAYNPNLSLGHSWPYLASAPRVTKPWVSG